MTPLAPPVPSTDSRPSSARVAVLLSGGLDSAVLLAEEASRSDVQPIYVQVGFAWEALELSAVRALLAALATLATSTGRFAIDPLIELSLDMRDVYPASHWAVVGQPPQYNTPDEDVYLAGRNIILLGKAGVYCASAGISRLVLGTLGHNPFPDATPAFRQAMSTALSLGLDHELAIEAPFADVDKVDVVRRGVALAVPMGLTLSCMKPVTARTQVSSVEKGTGIVDAIAGVQHCGTCSKCRERHDAFVAAGVTDPTLYADRSFVDR